MKLIDRKGKLFGLINIVDLLVLILIIGFISVVCVRFYSQRLNANGGNPLSEKEDVYITLYSNAVVPEVADNLQIGDKLVANGVYTTAEVVDIKVEPAAYVSTNSEGEAVLSYHPLWKDVTVVIKDTVNPSSVILKAGNQEVRVGYSFILKTQTVEINTKIRGISFGNYLETKSSEDSVEESEEELQELEELEESQESSNVQEKIPTADTSSTSSTTTNTATSSSTTTTSSSSSQATTPQVSSTTSPVESDTTPNLEEDKKTPTDELLDTEVPQELPSQEPPVEDTNLEEYTEITIESSQEPN